MVLEPLAFPAQGTHTGTIGVCVQVKSTSCLLRKLLNARPVHFTTRKLELGTSIATVLIGYRRPHYHCRHELIAMLPTAPWNGTVELTDHGMAHRIAAIARLHPLLQRMAAKDLTFPN